MTFSESLSAVNLLRERKTHIHLILIEVHMPIMDGYEFLQFVKKERINVPVISTTTTSLLYIIQSFRFSILTIIKNNLKLFYNVCSDV